MFKKKQTFLVILFAVLALTSGSLTLAYWANSVRGIDASATADTIVIGSGSVAETTIAITGSNTAATLVPQGRKADDQVEEVILSFDVKWDDLIDKTATGATSTVKAATEAITIGSDATYGHLVNVEFLTNDVPITIGETVTIQAKATLTEPESKAIYDAIINKQIDITFSFTIADTE